MGVIATAVRTTYDGYHASPAPERVLFGLSTSFTVTIAASRTLNYVREQRRNMPRLRSFGRLLATAPTSNSVRVHHFLPGTAIGFLAGGVALISRAETLERWFSLPFGVGLAMTTDELRLMGGRNNPYWGGEHFAIAQGGIALVATMGLALDFARRGRVVREAGPAVDEPPPDTGEAAPAPA